MFCAVSADSIAQDQNAGEGIMAGLEAGITYTTDLFGNLAGGSDTGIRYLDNLDVELQFDTDAGLGWGSAEFYIYGLANQGGSISELAGDLQGVSNIEAENSWRIYEFWLQKYFYGLRTSVLAGLYDLNAEFDVINTATLFINSSHGIGAEYALSGVLGPSIFPYTSIGIRLRSNPYKGLVLKAAALDGIPSNPENTEGTKIYFRERDGLLLAGEVAYYSAGEGSIARSRTGRIRRFLSRGVGDNNRFKAAVGGWIYTKERTGWDLRSYRERGVYAFVEYRLLEDKEDPVRGLSAFGRFGLSNEKVSRLKGYGGAGLVYTGLIPDRPRDQLGLAMAIPVGSESFKEIREPAGIELENYELNVEATYRLQVRNFSFVQLDLQYVVNPSMVKARDNALVTGIRFQLSL